MHNYHEALPGYHPEQLLHDGCFECEARGRRPDMAITQLDGERFPRAWKRAGEWQVHGTLHVSRAELPLLRTLAAIQIQLERRGTPIGQVPT